LLSRKHEIAREQRLHSLSLAFSLSPSVKFKKEE